MTRMGWAGGVVLAVLTGALVNGCHATGTSLGDGPGTKPEPEARALLDAGAIQLELPATAQRWQGAGVVKGAHTEVLIPDCVDAALFFLLNAVDQGVLRLQFKAADGRVLDLTTEGNGELAGWYSGEGGWRSRFSAERVEDDPERTT